MLYHVKLSVTSIEVLLGLQWKLWNMVKTVQRNPYNISEYNCGSGNQRNPDI